MSQIPLDILTTFEDGEFSFTEIPGSFNGLWSDMATEKTVIKNAKEDGGIVGLTRKKPALIRWTLTRHIAAQYPAAMKERSGITSPDNSVHQQEKAASMKQDEDHVRALISHLKNNMTNPFDCSFLDHNVPLNISTGMHATEEVQSSLLNAVKNGKDQMEAFVTRTFSESKRESLYSPISRSGVKTFGDMAKETKIKVQGQIKRGIISSEVVFRRALTLANCRQDVTLETVLSHLVGPVSASMFHDDGTMRKRVKADLALGLEDGVNSLVELNNTNKDLSVLIRDAMAIIQATQTSDVKTFDDFGKTYF